MGVYQSDMIFQQPMPLVLPKFGILIKYYEIPGAFDKDILFHVYLPGDVKDSPAVTNHVPRSSMHETKPGYDLEADQERMYNLTLPIMLSPLPIAKEGFVKVRAVCGDVVTNLGSLMLRGLQPNEKIAGLNA